MCCENLFSVLPAHLGPPNLGPFYFSMLRRQSKYWCVTINNPARPFRDPPISFQGFFFFVLDFRRPPLYACYVYEVGIEGTPHLQLYVCFSNKVRGSVLSNMLGGNPHLEVREGKHSQVIFFFIPCKEISLSVRLSITTRNLMRVASVHTVQLHTV